MAIMQTPETATAVVITHTGAVAVNEQYIRALTNHGQHNAILKLLKPAVDAANWSKWTRKLTDPFDWFQFIPLPFLEILGSFSFLSSWAQNKWQNFNVADHPEIQQTMEALFITAAVMQFLAGVTTLLNSGNKLKDLYKELNEVVSGKNTAAEKEEIDLIKKELESLSDRELSEVDSGRKNFLQKRLGKLCRPKAERIAGIKMDINMHWMKIMVNGLLTIAMPVTSIALVASGIVLLAVGSIMLSAVQCLSATCIAGFYGFKLLQSQDRLNSFYSKRNAEIKTAEAAIDADGTIDIEQKPAEKIKMQKEIIQKYKQEEEVLKNHVARREEKFIRYRDLAITSAVVLGVAVIAMACALPPVAVIAIAAVTTIAVSTFLWKHFGYNSERKQDIEKTADWIEGNLTPTNASKTEVAEIFRAAAAPFPDSCQFSPA